MVDFDVNVRLEAGSAQAQLRQMQNGLQSVENQAKSATGGFSLMGSAITGAMTALSTAAINAATTAIKGLGAAVVGSVQTFAGFEKSMSNVAALSGAVGSEFDSLNQKAKDLGATTRFSASEVADAMGFLAMAGFETNEILGSTQTMLDLAAAGNLDLARAADIASNVMGQFGVSAQDAERVTNVLAATAASANTNVDQLAEAMNYLGPTANALGVSLEETAAVIGVLGDSGIQASAAGRALGSALVRLADDSNAKVQGAIEELGLAVFDANGEFAGMEEFLRQIEEGLGGYTAEQKAATLSALLGAEAYQEINILLERGSEAYAEYRDSITDTNRAAEIAETQSDNLAGSWKILQSATEALQIAVGEELSPAVQRVIEDLSGAATEAVKSGRAQEIAKVAAEGLADAYDAIKRATDAIDWERLGNDIEKTTKLMGDLLVVAVEVAKYWGLIANAVNPLSSLKGGVGFLSNLFGNTDFRNAPPVSDPFKNRAYGVGNSDLFPDASLYSNDGNWNESDAYGVGSNLFDMSLYTNPSPQPVPQPDPPTQGQITAAQDLSSAANSIQRAAQTLGAPLTYESIRAFTGLRNDTGAGLVAQTHRNRIPNDRSWHDDGIAIDFGDAKNTREELINAAKRLIEGVGMENIREMFYTPLGFAIKSGQMVDVSQTPRGHDDHLHFAWNPGARFKGGLDQSGLDMLQINRRIEGALQGPMLTNPMAVSLGDPLNLAGLMKEAQKQVALEDFDEANRGLLEQIELIERKLELADMDATQREHILEIEALERESRAQLAEREEQLNELVKEGVLNDDEKAQQLAELITILERYKLAVLDTQEAEQKAIELQELNSRLQEQAQKRMERIAEQQARAREYVDQLTNGFTNLAVSVISGASSMEQALAQFFNTILSYLANQAFQSLFGSLFGGLFGLGGGGVASTGRDIAGGFLSGGAIGYANGGVVSGGFQAFANGGVVTRPTLGLIGEGSMNEAVVPLPDGRRIPVQMQGSGETNITVNVNNPSSGEDGRRLGRQISEAIKAELVQQSRVGGLLRR